MHFMIYGTYRDAFGWIPFSGFFFLEDDNQFEGTMTDTFGGSTITGEMKDGVIIFEKIYEDPQSFGLVATTDKPIPYELYLTDDGVQWEGSYENISKFSSHAVRCVINEYDPTEDDMADEAFMGVVRATLGR